MAAIEQAETSKTTLADALKNGKPNFTEKAYEVATAAVDSFVHEVVSTARADANKRNHEMVLNEHVDRALRTLGRTKRTFPLLSQLSAWMAGVGGGLWAPWLAQSTPPVSSAQVAIGIALTVAGIVGMVVFR
jgi:hypothetical protein